MTNNPLGEEKIHKLIIEYSLPAMVGMMVNSLYNVVDRIFIGNSPDLGADGLAGITVAFPIMIILMSMGILFGLGGATLFSIKLGEGKRGEAEKALGNSFSMLLISGIVFMVFGQMLLRPILSMFGASATVMPYAVEYMRMIFFGAVFQVGSMGMNNFIRADGEPKTAMITMFMGAGMNILLDAVFIFGLKMGMRGAALATVMAQGISFIWVIRYFVSGKSKVKIKKENLMPELKIVKRITALGIPGASLQMANSLLNAILNKNLFLYGGDIAVSAMGIINSLQMLLLLPVIGLRQGLQPIISFNFGAAKKDRVKSAAKQGVAIATVIVVISYSLTRAFPEALIAMFNRDPVLLEFGTKALKTWFFFMPVIGFQIIAASYFQAIGQSKTAMFLTLTRQVILLIPALLIFPRFWGLDGILRAAPFADIFSFILTGAWFYFSVKNLDTSSLPRRHLS
jgi:putative MATE family efflux protein